MAPDSTECLKWKIELLQVQVRDLQEKVNAGGGGQAVPAGLESRLSSLEKGLTDLRDLVGDPGKADGFEDIWRSIVRLERAVGLRRP